MNAAPRSVLSPWRLILPIQSWHQFIWCLGILGVLWLGLELGAPESWRIFLLIAAACGFYPSLLTVWPGRWSISSDPPAETAILLSDHLAELGYSPIAAAMPRVRYRPRRPFLAAWPEADIEITRVANEFHLTGPILALRRLATLMPGGTHND